jgi:hypothetical protein
MADIQKQNELLQREVARLKKEAALQKQNEALQKEIAQLKKAAALQCKLFTYSDAVTASC